MTDYFYHTRLAKEQRDGALREYEERRYSVVGYLALMAAAHFIRVKKQVQNYL